MMSLIEICHFSGCVAVTLRVSTGDTMQELCLFNRRTQQLLTTRHHHLQVVIPSLAAVEAGVAVDQTRRWAVVELGVQLGLRVQR